ncbi:MAG: glycosyltransferase [Pseudolabrys sp.]
MKILHVAPHLGGGVGKAHAALCAAFPDSVEQTFVLLEEPRDRRYADTIASYGARVRVAGDLNEVAQFARSADVVQFEFWNHPRLFECLARTDFPAMRCLFWSHVSGLFRPLIPPGLMAQAGRFVFSTEASRQIPAVAGLPDARIAVVNSGFGFAPAPRPKRQGAARIAYLGTVDFVKMHPGFFEAVDALERDIEVAIWGDFNPFGAVLAQTLAMTNLHRIRFHGPTATPADALAATDIFFYPLQPEHYGTAENALVEAMSLGLAPVVLDNPAEMAIVADGETGLVASSIAECTTLLEDLLASPHLLRHLGQGAARAVAATRTPVQSAQAFLALWTALAAEMPRHADFAGAIGPEPADWYLATQRLPGGDWAPSIVPGLLPAKGTLTHFEHVFDGDASLARLRG